MIPYINTPFPQLNLVGGEEELAMLGHPLTGLCLGQSQHSHSYCSMFVLLSYYYYYYYYVTFT